MMAFASCGSRTAKYTNAIRKRGCVVLVLRRRFGSDTAEQRANISVRFAAKQSKSRWGGWLPLPASQRQSGAVT